MTQKPKSAQPSLSEISHLFLTELRQRQTATSPNSVFTRKPPAADEQKNAAPSIADESIEAEEAPRPRVSAVLGHHLGQSGLNRVKEYARHLAAKTGRIGLIELGDDGLRVTCFDAAASDLSETGPQAQIEPVDGKRISQTIEEMSWDLQQWLVFLPGGPHGDLARNLLTQISHWTLLVTADDQGIVSGYRVLKGLAEIAQPSRSMAVFDAEDPAHAAMVLRKLAGTSKRFLHREIESEGCVMPAQSVAENIVLWCRASGSSPDHWLAVTELAAKSPAPASPVIAEKTEQPEPEPQPTPMRITPMEPSSSKPSPTGKDSAREVIDLGPTDADGSQTSRVLTAVLKRQTQWVTCPIKPPALADGMVAVDRDGRLTLLAVAASGMNDLRAISRAYGWLIENRPLVVMALPQMIIDAAAMPVLALFVDQDDVTGDQLTAIFQNGNVTIQTYRRLRWGEKTGLLLEAA